MRMLVFGYVCGVLCAANAAIVLADHAAGQKSDGVSRRQKADDDLKSGQEKLLF
jgi:hypothetical protein